MVYAFPTKCGHTHIEISASFSSCMLQIDPMLRRVIWSSLVNQVSITAKSDAVKLPSPICCVFCMRLCRITPTGILFVQQKYILAPRCLRLLTVPKGRKLPCISHDRISWIISRATYLRTCCYFWLWFSPTVVSFSNRITVQFLSWLFRSTIGREPV